MLRAPTLSDHTQASGTCPPYPTSGSCHGSYDRLCDPSSLRCRQTLRGTSTATPAVPLEQICIGLRRQTCRSGTPRSACARRLGIPTRATASRTQGDVARRLRTASKLWTYTVTEIGTPVDAPGQQVFRPERHAHRLRRDAVVPAYYLDDLSSFRRQVTSMPRGCLLRPRLLVSTPTTARSTSGRRLGA